VSPEFELSLQLLKETTINITAKMVFIIEPLFS
jgi:hypothetical protein